MISIGDQLAGLLDSAPTVSHIVASYLMRQTSTSSSSFEQRSSRSRRRNRDTTTYELKQSKMISSKNICKRQRERERYAVYQSQYIIIILFPSMNTKKVNNHLICPAHLFVFLNKSLFAFIFFFICLHNCVYFFQFLFSNLPILLHLYYKLVTKVSVQSIMKLNI